MLATPAGTHAALVRLSPAPVGRRCPTTSPTCGRCSIRRRGHRARCRWSWAPDSPGLSVARRPRVRRLLRGRRDPRRHGRHRRSGVCPPTPPCPSGSVPRLARRRLDPASRRVGSRAVLLPRSHRWPRLLSGGSARGAPARAGVPVITWRRPAQATPRPLTARLPSCAAPTPRVGPVRSAPRRGLRDDQRHGRCSRWTVPRRGRGGCGGRGAGRRVAACRRSRAVVDSPAPHRTRPRVRAVFEGLAP